MRQLRRSPRFPATGNRRQVFAERILLGFAIALGCWLLGWVITGDRFLLIRWGAYGAPWLGLLAMLSAIGSCFLRRWWLAAAMAILALIIFIPVLPRLSPSRWFARDGVADLRVVTFNVSELNDHYTAVAQMIADEKADIVLLQQTNNLPALLRALNARHLHYAAVPAHTADTIVLSRFAIHEQTVKADRTTAVIGVGRCRIRVWALHAPHGHEDVVDQQHYFEGAADVIRQENGALIVGGDFNSTEYNAVQTPLRDQLKDAYSTAGFGLGLSFPSHVRRLGVLGRLVAIDHILYRGNVQPVFVQVVSNNANSDHYPVLATFDLTSHCL